ncbi:unnamed protein product, partial [Phaeothamnion confervicola]
IQLNSNSSSIQINEDEDLTAGGLLLSPTDPEMGRKPTTGEVMAVGPGAVTPEGEVIPTSVEAGDLVKFRDFAGTEVSMMGKMYRVMRQGDVLVKW